VRRSTRRPVEAGRRRPAGKNCSKSINPKNPTASPFLSLLTYYVVRDSLDRVIESFRDKRTRSLFEDRLVQKFRSIERQARRRLLYLHQAKTLNDLAALPSSRLEKLSGNRRGQYSIRINDQWPVCFRWKDGRADDVEITDYH